MKNFQFTKMKSFYFFKLLADMSQYKLDENPIGEGNFGVVYKALRAADERHPKRHPEMVCAVKKLKAEAIKTQKDQENFRNEVKNQYDLKHVGIISLVGYTIPIMGEGDYSIITEFMPNGSLLKFIREVDSGNAPKNWDTIKAINIFGIAAAMAYIHQHKIIHRDLKTENIMLDENNYPKIGDFGLSKVFDDGKQAIISQTLQVGTPLYMAPELIDDPHYTNKVDVFAYAIVLYELTTYKKPWSDKKNLNTFNLLKYVQDGLRPTIKNREIPDAYVDLIEKCWDGNPTARPTFKQIVKDFRDRRDEFFDMNVVEEEIFEDYVDEALKGLNLDEEDEVEEEEE